MLSRKEGPSVDQDRLLPPAQGGSPEEFSRYWREEHAPLVREHAAALGIRRYVQSHRLADARLAPPLDARGCEGEPYDGVAEL